MEEIQTFAQLEGHKIYGQLDVDIIQIALQAPYLVRVHEQARKLARASPNRLYVEWMYVKVVFTAKYLYVSKFSKL